MGRPTQSFSSPRHRPRGMTYLGVLFCIAFMGIGLAVFGATASIVSQRAKEQQLLWIGNEFRQAIMSYYRFAGAGGSTYPQSLGQLLEDTRTNPPQRHLRRIYADPFTGEGDWEIITLGDRMLVGLASSAQLAPLKRGNFAVGDEAFANARCVCDWRFVYLPQLQKEEQQKVGR